MPNSGTDTNTHSRATCEDLTLMDSGVLMTIEWSLPSIPVYFCLNSLEQSIASFFRAFTDNCLVLLMSVGDCLVTKFMVNLSLSVSAFMLRLITSKSWFTFQKKGSHIWLSGLCFVRLVSLCHCLCHCPCHCL